MKIESHTTGIKLSKRRQPQKSDFSYFSDPMGGIWFVEGQRGRKISFIHNRSTENEWERVKRFIFWKSNNLFHVHLTRNFSLSLYCRLSLSPFSLSLTRSLLPLPFSHMKIYVFMCLYYCIVEITKIRLFSFCSNKIVANNTPFAAMCVPVYYSCVYVYVGVDGIVISHCDCQSGDCQRKSQSCY